MMEAISYKESLTLERPQYIDVRSPSEYAHDHIPGAVNIPIFDDIERKEIGTMYRHAGRSEAITRGLEIGGEKIPSIVTELNSFENRSIVIYCARGGMRSSSVASLVSSLGFRVCRLASGYKGYRHYVLEMLAGMKSDRPLFVLQGLTGTGKTEIIRHCENSIDLEGMAGHRSSLFGGIGLIQNTQKRFESLLVHRLRELDSSAYHLIEGESKKIGNLHIPPDFYAYMKQSPVIYVQADLERRIEIITAEYSRGIDTGRVVEIVQSLKMKLGSQTVETLIELFNRGNLHDFVEILLLQYYDPLYNYSLTRLNPIGVVENTGTVEACSQMQKIIEDYFTVK